MTHLQKKVLDFYKSCWKLEFDPFIRKRQNTGFYLTSRTGMSSMQDHIITGETFHFQLLGFCMLSNKKPSLQTGLRQFKTICQEFSPLCPELSIVSTGPRSENQNVEAGIQIAQKCSFFVSYTAASFKWLVPQVHNWRRAQNKIRFYQQNCCIKFEKLTKSFFDMSSEVCEDAHTLSFWAIPTQAQTECPTSLPRDTFFSPCLIHARQLLSVRVPFWVSVCSFFEL